MSECRCNCESKMMTIEELSDYINISKSILYKGFREKSLRIPHIKINKAIRFLKADVDAWIYMNIENTGPEVIASLKENKEEPFDGNTEQNYTI